MLAIEKLEISHSWKYKNDETAVKAHQKWTKIDDENFFIINLRENIDETLMKNVFPHTLLPGNM